MPLGITAALATSVISAPLASAAQLTITDDVCTTTLSEAEVETALRIFEDAGHTLVAEMKKTASIRRRRHRRSDGR